MPDKSATKYNDFSAFYLIERKKKYVKTNKRNDIEKIERVCFRKSAQSIINPFVVENEFGIEDYREKKELLSSFERLWDFHFNSEFAFTRRKLHVQIYSKRKAKKNDSK